MTNWKTFAEKSQAKRFVLPAGWETRAAIAEQMNCTEDNVRKVLAPDVRSGAVECKQLPLWDDVTKKVRNVACYREVEKAAPSAKK
jgi:hypothetical protein